MTRIFFILLQIVLVLFVLSGCGPQINTPEQSLSVTPVIPSTPTMTEIIVATPQPTNSLTPTAPATLSPEQEQVYSELLELVSTNGGCELPCLWGLTPGLSTFQDAQAILDPFSAVANSYFTGDKGGITITYPIDNLFLQFFLRHSTLQDSSLEENTIGLLYVSTYMYERVIKENGELLLNEMYDTEAYKEIMSAYTLSAMLSKFGPPADIIVRAEADESPSPERVFLTILYPDKGIFATYKMQGERADNDLSACPANSFVELWLLPESVGEKYEVLLSSIENWEGNLAQTQPLEQATEMTIDEFYQTFKDSSDACLQTPFDMWLIR